MRVLARPTAAFRHDHRSVSLRSRAQESYRTQQSVRPIVNLTSRDQPGLIHNFSGQANWAMVRGRQRLQHRILLDGCNETQALRPSSAQA